MAMRKLIALIPLSMMLVAVLVARHARSEGVGTLVDRESIGGVEVELYLEKSEPRATEPFRFTVRVGWSEENISSVEVSEIDLRNLEMESRETRTTTVYRGGRQEKTVSFVYGMRPLAEGVCTIDVTLTRRDSGGVTQPLKPGAIRFDAIRAGGSAPEYHYLAAAVIIGLGAAVVLLRGRLHRVGARLSRLVRRKEVYDGPGGPGNPSQGC